jgi:hypothetical protein
MAYGKPADYLVQAIFSRKGISEQVDTLCGSDWIENFVGSMVRRAGSSS